MNKFIVIAAFLVLGALAHDGKKPRPRPRFPVVLVKSAHKGEKGKPFGFKFAVLNFGNATLDVANLHLKKVNIRNKTLDDADFDIKAKVIDRDDVKEKIEEIREKIEDIREKVEDRKPHPKPHPEPHHKPHPKPHPRPHPKPNSAIIGVAGTKELTCEHRGFYILAYGKRPEPRAAEKSKDRKPHPKPFKKFVVIVEGCRKPDPEEK